MLPGAIDADLRRLWDDGAYDPAPRAPQPRAARTKTCAKVTGKTERTWDLAGAGARPAPRDPRPATRTSTVDRRGGESPCVAAVPSPRRPTRTQTW